MKHVKLLIACLLALCVILPSVAAARLRHQRPRGRLPGHLQHNRL